jgi:aryl-alcohol dehydrogenase-like predicted oxidoreductase
MIESRPLGSQGLVVSALGLGCMGMSEFYAPTDDAESIATIHRALDVGITLVDTADMYGPFKNERLVGGAVHDRRAQIVIATKFGQKRADDGRFLGIDGTPAYVRRACEASLARLGVDVIDLYYQHRVDPDVPIEDTVGAMADLVQAGKVRFIGLSEAGAGTIRRAHAVHPITAIQTEYSLWTRDPEDEVLRTCAELGIGFVAYSPLGRGFLTGRFKQTTDIEPGDRRHDHPRFHEENFHRNLAIVRRLEPIATAKRCTLAQLALAWLLSRHPSIVPIFGAKHVRYVEENIGALEVRLTDGDLRALDEAAPKGATAGLRYPASAIGNLNR